VNPTNPHPEYPRPTMARERWQNLNGLWDYAIVPTNAPQPPQFDGKIGQPPMRTHLSLAAQIQCQAVGNRQIRRRDEQILRQRQN
jgi:hypothetical protein